MSIHDGELELIDDDLRIETPPPRPSETVEMEFVEGGLRRPWTDAKLDAMVELTRRT